MYWLLKLRLCEKAKHRCTIAPSRTLQKAAIGKSRASYTPKVRRLPRASGGFGASNAKFNVRINIDSNWQYILKKPYLVVDALFHVHNTHTRKKRRDSVIEFNGLCWHGGCPQMNEDNLRRHALENAGYDVRFITGRDFYDFRAWT